ncbi:MAG: GNAT family N-acetyltransferase [Candidatus Hodarchaeota archaeon]
MDFHQVKTFQELTNNAWPAKEYFFLYGWILRLSNGNFTRTNSVFPIRYFGSNLKQDIERVEDIYQKKKLDVAFQIPVNCDPSNLDKMLSSLDYEEKYRILVMTKKISNSSLSKLSEQDIFSVKVSDFNNLWFDKFVLFGNESPTQKAHIKEVLKRNIIPKRFFFSLSFNQEIVGVTLAVREEKYLGLSLVAVDPEMRRKGIGSFLMRYIINWCINNRLETIYLQVYHENTPALLMYEKLGFKHIFNYHYRIKTS